MVRALADRLEMGLALCIFAALKLAYAVDRWHDRDQARISWREAWHRAGERPPN